MSDNGKVVHAQMQKALEEKKSSAECLFGHNSKKITSTPIDEELLNKLRPKIRRKFFLPPTNREFKNFVSQFETEEEIILYCVRADYTVVELASKASLNDEEFMIKAISGNPNTYQLASESLKNDKNFRLKAVGVHGWVLKLISEEERDYALCLEAVKTHGGAIQFVPEKFQNLKLCKIAVKNHEGAYSYIRDDLKNHKDILLALLSHNYIYYDHKSCGKVPDDLKNDKKILETLKETEDRLFKDCPYYGFHPPRFIDDENPFQDSMRR